MADGAADLPLASHVSQSSLPCDACAAGKSHRQPLPKKATHRATRCLELVHSDMWGPIDVDAHGGWNGFLTFIDDFSREAVVYLMNGKSGADVLTHLTDYKAWAENVTGQRLTVLRTDNGGEFINTAADRFLRQHGVTRQVTTAYTSSQNGVAERFNRTIMDTVRSMLHHANLADSLWPLAVQAATYVKNRCPTVAVQHMTPHQAWYGHRPNLHSLRVFGCVAHLHVPEKSDERINKLSARSVPCINVGYSLRSKGYLLYNPRTRRVHTSKDVTFEETRFIGADSPLARRHIGEGEMSVLFPDVAAAASQQLLQVDDAVQGPPAIAAPEDIDDEQVEAGLADYSDHELEQSESDYEDSDAYNGRPGPAMPQMPVDVDDSDDALDRMPLSEMAQRYGNAAPAPPLLRRSQRGGGLPSSRALDSTQHVRILYTESASETCGDDEPSSYSEAMSRPDAAQWKAAIDSELDSLKRTGTWTLTPLAAGRQAIGSRWVLKIKRKADGTVDKYKARLVAKGYAQKAGIDYDETFAPVAKFTSIRMLLALAAHHDFEIHHMDVKTAFLNGDLDVDIYMEQPEGYSTPAARGEQRLVCKLQKALYGLKQAGRAWNEKMLDALLQLQFTPLDSDSCVFVHRDDSYVMFVALYVDDLLLFSSSLPRLVHLKSRLSQLFEMTDMGEAHYILGLKITRNRSARQLCLSQQEYLRRVVERYGMTNCNPASTPLTTGTVLSKDDCPSTPPATPVTINGYTYASVVGAVMYAMLGTRPDLAYSVGCLSRFNSNPGATHVAALKHVLRYLAGTTDYQLVYGTQSTSINHPTDNNEAAPPFAVFGYCDSDYAACVDERLSVAGWVFMAAGGATSWQSQKQKAVALSTVEAEYMAACAASKEGVWQRAVLAQVGVSTDSPMLILTDNQGAMALAKNPNHHQRSKHIDVRYHYVRRQVAKCVIRLDYVATADQAADQLTKPLSKVQHDRCLAAMGIRSASAPANSPLKLYTLRS